jgi:hypothetical protein
LANHENKPMAHFANMVTNFEGEIYLIIIEFEGLFGGDFGKGKY